jgi:hypothetical protein
MSRPLRYGFFMVCIIQIAFALAFIFQVPAVTRLWPLSYTNATTFIFIGSIFAAAAASTLWCLIANEYGALAGVALDYILIFGPTAIFALQTAGSNMRLRNFGLVGAAVVLVGVGMLLWSSRIPIRHQQPVPRTVYIAFILFVIALVIAGGLMVTKYPDVLPWDVPIQGQIIYGWFFLGAAAFFAYGILRPSWHNAGAQLAGFLAYDLVLIVPFLRMLATIPPDRLVGLLIYIAVVSFSGLLAIYYLFVNPATRTWMRGARSRH